MTNILLIYIIYNNIFRNHFDLIYHIKHDHQSLIKIKFENRNVIEVKKEENDIFKYKCEKKFKFLIIL